MNVYYTPKMLGPPQEHSPSAHKPARVVESWQAIAPRLKLIEPPAVTIEQITLQLVQAGITPQSVTITWNDGAPRTATDDGAGRITGAATGTTALDVRLNPLPTFGGALYSIADAAACATMPRVAASGGRCAYKAIRMTPITPAAPRIPNADSQRCTRRGVPGTVNSLLR